MRETNWVPDRKKRQKDVVLPLRFLWNQENKICQDASEAFGKLSRPSQGGGFGELAMTGLVQHAIPWLGKKAVEMGRFGASELLRNKNAQKKALDFALDKAKPFLAKTSSNMLDQLSTKIRPNKKYKTDRADLDGAGVDVHSLIGKLPRPKKGFTLPGHNYTGPWNPLDKQVRFNENGKILEIMQQPTGKTDAVAMQHDVDYSICAKRKNPRNPGSLRRCKNKADRKMVAALDAIPRKERQWGHALARNTINAKQKLGLGFASPPFGRLGAKNGKRF